MYKNNPQKRIPCEALTIRTLKAWNETGKTGGQRTFTTKFGFKITQSCCEFQFHCFW